MLVPMIQCMGDMGYRYEIPARLTGLWKIERDTETGGCTMYVQVKGLIFKRWEPENNIVLRATTETTINRCN